MDVSTNLKKCLRVKKKIKEKTVTGANIRWTLFSSVRISRALAQRALTSDSLMISQFFSCSI